MSLSSRIIPKLHHNPSFLFLASKPSVAKPWHWQSYGDLLKAVTHSREVLRDNNIQKGDRVAFKGHNSFEWIAWNLATNSLGAIWVPMYHDQNRDYCQHIVNDCEPKLLLSDGPNMDLSIPQRDITLEPCDTVSSFMEFDINPVSTLIYTSGTTYHGQAQGSHVVQ